MRRRKCRWRYGLIGVGLVLVLAASAFVPRLVHSYRRRRPEWERLPKAAVRRADLWVSVTAGGLIESANQTVIECELQALDVGVRGQRLSAGGASTILSLTPEGTMVKKGDILCRLDASAYEELLLQQEMTVERAKSDHRQAELNLQVAQTAVTEFRDGIQLQTLKENEGQIASARWEWERVTDRLGWSRRMFNKGYVSAGQVSSDEVGERRAAFSLEQSQMRAEVFRRFEAPRTLHELRNNVISAQLIMDYQTSRLRRHLDRLENLRRQIENCTIRAPHDGFLIYANDPGRQVVLEPGMTVRQLQRLFYLPDLSKMEVSALLHESVVDKVGPGMRAQVRVEGLPGRVLEGHVVSIARLPTRNFFSEVPYYSALVKIDTIPRGLRPGMSAEVEIATARRSDVLAIPPEAMTIEDGHEVCYVAGDDGPERREVSIGQATQDQLEVTRGLKEGEQVVLDPAACLDPSARSEPSPPAESEGDAPGVVPEVD